jgi:hypothetical protein
MDDRYVMGVPTLLLPVAGLVLLWVSGLGAADLLAKRMRLDARAALAAPLAAAALVSASPLVLAGVSPYAVALAVLGLLGALTVARARVVARVARKAAWPALIAVLALAVSAAPSLRNGTWSATSYGNADPYVWVSQAKSLSDGPPALPRSAFPDRGPYELITKGHWATGLPVGLAAVSSLGGLDPAQAYEAFAAIISALLALGVFAAARGCLRWSSRLAALASGAVATNGLLLMSSYYGWQAQLLLTAFGTLAILTLPVCMDRKALARESALPALFIAAGVATYGWIFAPFVGVAGAVALACWLVRARSSVGRRRIVVRTGAVVGLALVLGLVPIVEATRSFAEARGRLDPAVLRVWANYDWAFPSDALGLIARAGVVKTPGTGWSICAIAVAVALLSAGVTRVRAFRNPRGYVLVAAAAAVLALLAALALTGASPYTSMKLMGYAAPLLTLLAVSAFAHRRPRGTRVSPLRILGRFASVLFALTTAVTVAYAVIWTRPATIVDGAVAAANRLPQNDGIRINYKDAWHQVWLVYFLRDRPLSVNWPSVYLTGFSAAAAAKHHSFTSPASYEIAPVHRGPAVWRSSGAGIYRLPVSAVARARPADVARRTAAGASQSTPDQK